MTAPNLVEIRTSGQTKSELRTLINDVETEFPVGGSRGHVVPHVPLFGRYDTNQSSAVKQSLVDVFSGFDVVPYTISGFGTFENETVYADIVPSLELVSLRRQISRTLQSVTFSYPAHDSGNSFRFHIPIIRGDRLDDADTTAVLHYLGEQYDPDIDEYATRITNLRGNEMLWEYDLLQEQMLEYAEATSRESWRRTEALLDERAGANDHKKLVSELAGDAIESLRTRGWQYYARIRPATGPTSLARRSVVQGELGPDQKPARGTAISD